jgi:small nuclear ribonucleoprotein (snRNP)-like protein
MSRKSKFSFLLKRRVQVVLKDSRKVTGQLLAYDKCMNLVLAEAADNCGGDFSSRVLGLIILRGASIVSVTLDSSFVNSNHARVPASFLVDQKNASNVN